MQLPLRDFADVIAALKGPGGEKSGAGEKRRAARMTVTAKFNIHIVVNGVLGKSFSALTRDISLTGMGVLQAIALQQNQSIVVALPRSAEPLYVVSTVMHCRPLADGLLAVGLEFAEMASKETVTMLQTEGSRQAARIADSVLR
jgi:c-di-GMP-binding flagellar brake protein YcgR